MEKKYNIPLSKPDITDAERKAVLEVLKTKRLVLGKKLKKYERKIFRIKIRVRIQR